MVWYHWVFGFFIALSFLLVILSIPSIISMFRIGRMDYFRNIKLLFNLKKGINICYKLTTNRTYNYQYNNGSIKTTNQIDIDYYFPVYVNDKNVFIVNKRGKGLWYNLIINDAKYDGKDWITDIIEIKTSTCMLTQILNDRFQSKLDRLSKNEVVLEDIKDLNELINSEIVSIRRDSKLNLLING